MRYLALCLLVLTLGLPATAASGADSTTAPGGSSSTPASYLFVPGDVIEITVSSHPDYDRTITVQPDGRLHIPSVGEIVAAGLTPDQLAARIQTGLEAELVDPKVTVSLKELNKQAVPRVSVLGAVKTQGVFPIKEGTTVAEALAAAGGPVPLADLRRVTVTRSDQSVTTLDLAQSKKTGHLEQNIKVQPGDIIIVPEGTAPTVMVLGEVLKPGSYPIQGEARLVDAISQAGGPTPKADLRRVAVTRLGAAGPEMLDLQPLLTHGKTAKAELNVLLQPGDTIVLTETDQQVYVLGRVAKPDTYAIKPNDRVLDALAKAGQAPDGDVSRAVLVRRDENGQPVAKKLDVKKMMAKASLEENELLRPGDVLFVPDKKDRRRIQDYVSLIWPLNGLLNILSR
jgi:polysaccharide export outer membrane protein